MLPRIGIPCKSCPQFIRVVEDGQIFRWRRETSTCGWESQQAFLTRDEALAAASQVAESYRATLLVEEAQP
jgi:hypothetical protein